MRDGVTFRDHVRSSEVGRHLQQSSEPLADVHDTSETLSNWMPGSRSEDHARNSIQTAFVQRARKLTLAKSKQEQSPQHVAGHNASAALYPTCATSGTSIHKQGIF